VENIIEAGVSVLFVCVL